MKPTKEGTEGLPESDAPPETEPKKSGESTEAAGQTSEKGKVRYIPSLHREGTRRQDADSQLGSSQL